jgi:tetratricopeptide (TPR) repeat protein
MAGNRRCFLICPIGKETSDVRQKADDLLDLIVMPALQIYNFEVIRADKIPRPSVITSDIIQLVQNSDLCIIDLTGSNPNVFYECGRRHETGKPFIQLIRKDEVLPFDVSGIRTISYDLSTPRSVNEAVKSIQSYIHELDKSGFKEKSSGESLSSIAATLDRIERKVNLMSSTSPIMIETTKDYNPMELLELQANPEKAFVKAFETGNLGALRSSLPQIEKQFGPCKKTIVAALVLANIGDSIGAEILERNINVINLSELKYEDLQHAIGSLIKYYSSSNEADGGSKKVLQIIDKILLDSRFSDSERAFFENQKQKIFYIAEEYEDALKYCQIAIELDPDETAYLFNASLLCEKLNLHGKSVDYVDKYIEIGTRDPDHLEHAVIIYARNKKIEEARRIFSELRLLDDKMALNLLKQNSDISNTLK